MGTSKGYIAPTTPHWSQAKRAVTSYINNGDSGARAYAANKFVGAMKHDISSSESLSEQVEILLLLLMQYQEVD